MNHSFTHIVNCFRPNSELRNCLPEIKDVVQAHHNLDKHRRSANKILGKWASHQDPAVDKFMIDMIAVEDRMIEYEEGFVAAYQVHRLYWKEILEEHSELFERETAYVKAKDKAQKALDHLHKDESHHTNVAISRAKLGGAQEAERITHEELRKKLLEVERELFDKLRNAYYKLHDARLAFLKQSAYNSERALAIIQAFPAVASLAEDGTLVLQQANPDPAWNFHPTWHKGDEIMQELSAARSHEARYNDLAAKYDLLQSEVATLRGANSRPHTDAEVQHSEPTVQHAVNGNEMQHAADMAVAQLGRAALFDAYEGLTVDIADFLTKRATTALEALNTLGGPLAASNVVSGLVGCLHAIGAASNALEAGVRAQLKPIADAIFTLSTELFRKIETGTLRSPADAPPMLREQLGALLNLARSLQIHGGIPSDIQRSIATVQTAITDGLAQLQQSKDNSERVDRDETLAVNQELLDEGMRMLASAKNVVNAAIAMQGEMQAKSDYTLIRKWLTAMRATVDTLQADVPQWLTQFLAVLQRKGNVEELEASTRNISNCSFQLVDFVRVQRGRGAAGETSVIEKSTLMLQRSSHRVLAIAEEIGRSNVGALALADYNRLGGTEAKQLLYATQASIFGLEKALQHEREKMNAISGQLRKADE